MSSIRLIRRHISSLAPGEIVTTRQFMNYGTRSAVDQALLKLVKMKEIDRLSSGVFVDSYKRRPEYTAEEILQAKADAFDKKRFETSYRREHLANEKYGEIIRTLWQMGEKNCDLEYVQKVTANWDREQVHGLLGNARWMPYWLLKHFREVFGYATCRKVAYKTIEDHTRTERKNLIVISPHQP